MAILVFQNNEMVAMLVAQTIPVGVELFSYANAFFCSNKFAEMLGSWMKTLYSPLSVPLCLATTHEPVPVLISVFPSILFGLSVQREMLGSVSEMWNILKPSRYQSFQSGLKSVFTVHRFPPQDCESWISPWAHNLFLFNNNISSIGNITALFSSLTIC